jgi:large subunit ribosomal protein L25
VCTPRNIPDEFVVDISAMKMDTVIRLSDVAMPDGFTPTGDPEMAVVTVLVMRASELETDAVAAEEGAEGEVVEGEAEGGEAVEGEGGGSADTAGESGGDAGN